MDAATLTMSPQDLTIEKERVSQDPLQMVGETTTGD
jgi:hypothetical protein